VTEQEKTIGHGVFCAIREAVMQDVSKRALQWYSERYCGTKAFTLKAYKLPIVESVERWIVCMSLSVSI
jgi:hypothetical protein